MLYTATMEPLLAALQVGHAESILTRFSRTYNCRCSKIVTAAAAEIGWIQVSSAATGFHLDQLHIVPGWRGRGIGTALVGRLLARAGRAGLPVGLDVIRGNPAFALYRRIGFTVIATDHEKHKMVWQPA